MISSSYVSAYIRVMENKKISILFVLAHLNINGGVARVLVNLCNHLDLDKYDISILPLYRVDKELVDLIDSRIKIKKGFGLYFKGFSHLLHLIPKRWLYRFLVREKYDIEIAFQTDIPTLMIAASTNNKAVHVFWMHGYHLWKDSYLTGDAVYCVSKCNADRCRSEMNSSVPVDYCYNLIDDEKIISLSKERIDTAERDCIEFVSVGRFTSEKGYPRLVRILSELHEEGYVFHLTLVGDGPERNMIEQEISRLNMSEHITLVGKQVNPHKYTAKADVFICSSFSEGYSTACTEAAVLGIPIITTDVAGGQEIIEDCDCGILTQKDDDSLKAAIRTVLLSPQIIDEWKIIMASTCMKFKSEARQKKIDIIFENLSKLSDSKNIY